MQKFALEICHFSKWTLERDFSTMHRAMKFGLENMSHNDWRVVERRTGEIVHTHDGVNAIMTESALEERRFQHTDQWRERFANQRAAEIREQNNLRNRQRATQRQARLRGFQFVGDGPDDRTPHERWSDGEDVDPELHGWPEHSSKKKQKVNWIKEGF